MVVVDSFLPRHIRPCLRLVRQDGGGDRRRQRMKSFLSLFFFERFINITCDMYLEPVKITNLGINNFHHATVDMSTWRSGYRA